MPTYDYYCPANDRELSVFHAMSVRLSTWGELCELAAVDVAGTPHDAPVERRISGGLAPARPSEEPATTGCCSGSACGCSRDW